MKRFMEGLGGGGMSSMENMDPNELAKLAKQFK
jgi:hypothetical protein